MIKIRRNKGFTLIELLVVIAIIGILAAIALTSLRTAREKAKDASAIGSLSSARAQAEIYADTNGTSYNSGSSSTVCNDLEMVRLLAASDKQLGAGTGNIYSASQPNGFAVKCVSNPISYAVVANLLDTANRFCVDSTGFAGKLATAYGSLPLTTSGQIHCQ